MNKIHNYMDKLTKTIEVKIAKRLTELFALVFDGWPHLGTHRLAIFATLTSEDDKLRMGERGSDSVLLDLSLMEDKTSPHADEHMRLITFFLHVFKKSLTNIVVLIGESLSTNKSIAVEINQRFVGC